MTQAPSPATAPILMTHPLTLHDCHAALGAVFCSLGEREMVQRYSDPAAEAGAARAGAGVLDWGGGTRLRVAHTGKRTAHDFLQGLLSNEVPLPPAHRGCYATLLTNTGKVISDCRVWPDEDGFLLTTESAAGPALRDTLTKYGFLDDITVTDVSDTTAMFGLYGPQAGAVFDAATGAALPGLEPDALVPVLTKAGPVRVTRNTVTGQAGFHILVEPARAQALWTALTGAGAHPLGLDAFHVLRVEAGVPWVGAELDERVLPNQVNLEGAVSLTKGCYVGQEAVAKLHYLGRSNRRMVGLLLGEAAPPARDAVVLAGERKVGRVTSAVISATQGQTIALALCKTAAAVPGAALTVGEDIPATAAELPFLRPPDPFANFAEPEAREEPGTAE